MNKMLIHHLILIILLISVRSSVGNGSPASGTTNESILASVDRLTPPISVLAGVIPDGGTVTFCITDSLTNRLFLCTDGRNAIGTNRVTRSVYVGAGYPTDEGARQLVEGGSEARLLTDILEKWLAASFSKQERARLDIYNHRRFNDAFAESEERGHRYVAGCHVIRLLKRLEHEEIKEPNKKVDPSQKARIQAF